MIYTMLAFATIEADTLEAAETAMVEATPGLAGTEKITPNVALVAEGDWTMPLAHSCIDFMTAVPVRLAALGREEQVLETVGPRRPRASR